MRLRFSLLALVSLTLALSPLVAGRAAAGTKLIGTMSDWKATPSQTLDDKVFTWLASGTTWTGAEFLFISSNTTAKVHTLNVDNLNAYTGPLTLTVDYRIDILSRDVFDRIRLDSDSLSPTTVAYKDVFSSLALLQAAPSFGSGDLASLSSIDGFPSITPLPAIQQIWIRDTIQLGSSGQLNSVSNSVFQTVPEPSSVVLAGVAIAALTTWRTQRRLGRSRSA